MAGRRSLSGMTEHETLMSGGDALVLSIKANRIERVFGIPGVQTYPLFDALHRHSVETIVPRHEQAAAYMAMGAAKSTGEPSAFSVVPGPGILNAGAALCTAAGNCSPVMCLTGQIPSTFLGVGRGHLHELKDQIGTLKLIIKDAVRVENLDECSAIVNQAFRTMISGRPGPVSIEMCSDTMRQSHSVSIQSGNTLTLAPAIDPDQIDGAVKAIAGAKAPMIMCGAGAQGAHEEVQALAELLNCPVTAFRSGRGVVSEDHPLGVSSLAGRLLWERCDLLIGIGSRVEMPYMRWGDDEIYRDRPNDQRTLVRIDIDPQEFQRFKPDVEVLADAAPACRLLIEGLSRRTFSRTNRRHDIARSKNEAYALSQKIQPHIAYLSAIRAVLPRDGFLVPELCQAGFTAFFGFPVYEPRTFVSEGYQGTLGFGYSTALGVKIANADKAVVSINGDGGFLFGIQELATAAKYEIGVIAIVFNNSSFGNVRRDQIRDYGGRLIGTELINPNFGKLADSFGIRSVTVRNPQQLKQELSVAIDKDKPMIIEVITNADEEVSPWQFIRMAECPVT